MEKFIRENIKNLAPYSTARDEYAGELGIFLDANENPYNTELNRYPDPHQKELKKVISSIKGLPSENIFLGNGSDEPIDILYRVFCEPRQDNVVVIAPSYGMYGVSANINDVDMTTVQLNSDFDIEAEKILSVVKTNTKMIMLCSPNNPSGNILDKKEVVKIIEGFEGVVVIDEAYIDFSDDEGFLPFLNKYKNIVILQTLSKAWGMAGVRLGMAFASEYIVSVMSKVKYPYNIAIHTQKLLTKLLVEREEIVKQQISMIKNDRDKIAEILGNLNFVKRVFPSEANFILVQVDDAKRLYDYLIDNALIIRDRSKVVGCSEMLRISIGTESENNELIKLLKKYK